MNNIQKAFKNKAKRGLCMARGGITPGNNLTQANEMGAAASEMERTRLAGEADFRKRMSTPPVTAARGPLDNQVAMGEAMAGLSNTDRYKLGGSGTAAEASEIDQRNDIMKRLNAAMPEVPQLQVNRQPRPGLLGGQDELLGMNLARGTGSLNCASGVVFRDGNSFGDRPMMPATGLRPQRPVPTRVAPPTAVAPQRVAIPLPAPEYPQERVRPTAPAPTPGGTYPGLTGVVDAIRNRKVANANALDYACGTARVGHAAGGIVRGKGGPTDDEVPMSVGGTPVNLSPREAVLPVKTVMALGGPDVVEELIERTNGKPPVRSGLRAGGNYATGAGGIEIPDDYMRGRQPPPVQPTVPPLTPEQEMLKRAAASRAADAQARAAQEASQAARSAEAGMRTPGGGAQGAQSTMRQAFNNAGGIGNKTVGEAAEAVGQSAAKLGTKVWPVVKPVAGLVGGTLKKVPYAAAAIDATDVVDVVTDPNKDKWDVGQELVNKAGKWTAAGVGAGYGAKTGAALSTAASLAFPPAAPFLIPAGTAIGGVVGGVGGYMAADKLMRAGGHVPPSETADGLTSGIKRNIREKLGIELPGDAAFKTDEVRAAHEASMNGGAGTGKIKMPVSKEQMRAAAQAQVPVQTGTQVAPEPATAAAADIQARSMAAEGLRSGAQREMNLPPTQQQDVVNGGSLVQRGNVGLRSIATNPAVQDALNVANEQQGTGVRWSTVKGADGKMQNLVSQVADTKPQYIAADGTPTNDWKQTAQYAESKGLHARNKQALRDIEMENARGDMASALPFYQGRGLRTMATRLREDELAQKGQITAAQLAMQREGLDATIENRKEDNARAAKGAEQEAQRKFRDEVDNELVAESGRGGKDSAPIYAAQLKAYRANYEAGRKDIGKDPRNWAQEVAKQYRMEQLLNMKGQHYAVPGEREWDGETKTEWIYDPSSRFSDTFTDLTGKHRFRNKQTGQSIDLDHIRRLPPDMQRVFLKERVVDSKGENNIDMTRLLETAK